MIHSYQIYLYLLLVFIRIASLAARWSYDCRAYQLLIHSCISVFKYPLLPNNTVIQVLFCCYQRDAHRPALVTWCHTVKGCDITFYPMLRADSRFWLVNHREIWSRISRLTSSAWDIKTKERHWWRHNGDSDRRPLSLPLRYGLVTLCLYGDLGQINVIVGNLKLRKRFRMSQILFEHGINSLPLVCFRGYGNLSTLSIAIPRLAFGRAWYCNAACG